MAPLDGTGRLLAALGGAGGERSLYQALVAGPAGAALAGPADAEATFDRHVFACAIEVAAGEPRPLTEALGLSREALAALFARYFPEGAALLLPLPPTSGAGEDALEEPDLRRLLLDHRTRGIVEEEWLAAIVARRSLRPNHLWQDLGLFHRGDLSRLLHRHFAALAARNVHDMKWKKFFYRELCARDGVLVCKAPVCDVCTDVAHCFGGEEGEPLAGLAAGLSRQL